jgi:hypothetical protein
MRSALMVGKPYYTQQLTTMLNIAQDIARFLSLAQKIGHILVTARSMDGLGR